MEAHYIQLLLFFFFPNLVPLSLTFPYLLLLFPVRGILLSPAPHNTPMETMYRNAIK